MSNENLSAESWSKYWTQASNEVACLPGAPAALGNLLDGIWASLAERSKDNARVVDLACGNGVVGHAMLLNNDSLEITGVDYADLPNQDDGKYPVLGSTSITDMPFDDALFDCAVSQFGIEYAEPAEAGPEIARILKPGGTFLFIVHCAQSEIVKANAVRYEILDKIYFSPLMRTNAIFRNLQELQDSFDKLVQSHGEEPLILEIASAIRSTFSSSEADREKALAKLWDGMAQEMNIIQALSNAAVSEDGMTEWQKKLGSEFQFKHAEIIKYDGDSVCWSLSGIRI